MAIFLQRQEQLKGDGVYLVKVDGDLTIAEFDEPDNWRQLGIDFDIWSHGSEIYTVQIIGKINLNGLAIALLADIV